MLVVLARQAKEGQRAFNGLLHPVRQPGIAARPFGKPCGEIGLGLGEITPVVEPSEFLQAIVGVLARQVIERVPEEVHIAALPCCFRDHLADRSHQAGMVVGHDQFDAPEAARLQRDEEVPPGRAAFAIGHLHGQDLAPPIPVDADCDQHRLAHDDAGFAHLLVAGIEDKVGKGLLKRALGKGLQALVQPLVDGRDRRGRERMAAQLFGDRFDLPGRHALHIHLRKRRHQGPLGTLVTLEQFRGEAARPVLRNPQFKLADPRDKGTAIVTRAIAETLRCAFALRGAQSLIHLGLEHLLHHRADHLVQAIRVRKQNVFDGSAGGLTFCLGHGGVPSRESVTLNITSLP
ncbi:hypothetical protein MesoLj131b_72940 (plasmid) [Mesorhizobium sp. 131-2-5]|nr:hypothetical protein MesoLj131b_72940 [Mesorhizobium sp. 131-2-5]